MFPKSEGPKMHMYLYNKYSPVTPNWYYFWVEWSQSRIWRSKGRFPDLLDRFFHFFLLRLEKRQTRTKLKSYPHECNPPSLKTKTKNIFVIGMETNHRLCNKLHQSWSKHSSDFQALFRVYYKKYCCCGIAWNLN